MYTIEDLRNGKVAVINDGTIEELEKVLREAFPPVYNHELEGVWDYYFKDINSNSWNYDDETNLPTQSVKDFLNQGEEFKWGEKVEVSGMSPDIWIPAIYIGKDPNEEGYHVCARDSGFYRWSRIRKLQTKLELTRKQIAEKFGVQVEQLVIRDVLAVERYSNG